MASEFLSQDEVDALLRGVNGEPDQASDEPKPEDGIQTYQLGKQERIVRGRMPTLEIINDRFARLLRLGLFNFMRRNPDVSVEPVKLIKYGDFIRNLVVPTNLNVVQIRPLRGHCLIVIDPSLVFTVIDNMFGGDGRFHTRVEGREFTATEQRIIANMLQVVMEDYTRAWQPVHPIQLEFVRSEMHTQFANIATPSEIVVTTSFSVEIGDAGGEIHVCIPYSTVEPIRDLLYSAMKGESAEADKRWVRMLSRQVQTAEVELVANFTSIEVPLERILGMRVGDVVPVDVPESVTAAVDGVPLLECGYGTRNGHYALRIERILAVPREDNMVGEQDVH